MAGTALDRTLSTRFAVATHLDDASIRRLLRENPMTGAITLGFEREPSYFNGANLAGGEDQTIIALSAERLICMGRCTRRECWIDGHVRRAGYLGELRLDATARGRLQILRAGYEFFHALEADDPADVYFTSIGADNHRSRRLLEKGVAGLPAYVFLAELDTLLISVPRRAPHAMLRVERATPARAPDLLRVLNDHGRRHHLSAVWTMENLHALESQGLPLDRFLLAFDGGDLLACAGLWDQRGFRQTVIRGYSAALARARPFINFASRFLGVPRLPRVGAVLPYAFLSPLACKAGTEPILPDLIAAFFPLAAEIGAEYLSVVLPSMDPTLPALRHRFSTRTWRSRLYRVDWPDRARSEFGTGRAFLPEGALL